jgi:uncharacterized membrane protein (DUF485 family)
MSLTDDDRRAGGAGEAGAIAHRSPNQRLGLVLFFIYFLFYAAFIVLTVYDYRLLAREVAAGINLAVAYGIGLILLAIALAILYAALAKPDAVEPAEAAEI